MFSLFARYFQNSSPASRRGGRRRKLEIQSLEDRMVLSTFAVLSPDDSGPGSLRQAISDANLHLGADTVVVGRSVREIALTSGELQITDALTIDGPGARRLTISGNDASRVFAIASGIDVTVSDLSITDGLADGDSPVVPSAGGGILNLGRLTLSHVVMDDNQAVGDPNAVVVAGPAFKTAGGALGGGVANFGVLNVVKSAFSENRAAGADDVNYVPSVPSDFPFGTFPGNSFGGAISNYTTDYGTATATVHDSQFDGNVAQAGSRGDGSFAAIAGGGAIANDSSLTVVGGSFTRNQAIGGDDSVSAFHNGHALGGAISTGSLTPALAPVTGGALTVNHSTFSRNQSLGGSHNKVTLPPSSIPRADGPNNGYGGAILAFQGSAAINDSTLAHNQAVGGHGGAGQNGGLGVGGGVFFFNFLGPVQGTIDNSAIVDNAAVGGASTDSAGGDGLGGGVAIGSLGAPFGAPGVVEITHTLLANNRARGGASSLGNGGNGQGGGIANLDAGDVQVAGTWIVHNQAIGGRGVNGGHGQGGGVFNGAGATIQLTHSPVNFNRARGGSGSDGDDGLGQGGGVFNDATGVFDVDAFSEFWIRFNTASDDGDNVFGTLSRA